MALFEEEPKAKSTAYVVGQDVALMSVADLTERIMQLQAEIARLEGEREQRGATKTAAEALFRR